MSASQTSSHTHQTPSSTDVAAAGEGLRTAAAKLRDAVGRQEAIDADALLAYRAKVDWALDQLQADLAAAAHELEIAQPDSSPDVHGALVTLNTTIRGAVDEIRVRTRIGRMDLRDARGHLVEEAESIGHRIVALVDELRREAVAPFEDLGRRSSQVVHDLRRGMGGIDAMARADDCRRRSRESGPA